MISGVQLERNKPGFGGQSSTQASSYAPSPTDSQPQGASGLPPQPPPDYYISADEGRTRASALAETALRQPAQTIIHGGTVSSPAITGIDPAQQAMEVGIAPSAWDPFEGLSDATSWNPEWDNFFNADADLI